MKEAIVKQDLSLQLNNIIFVISEVAISIEALRSHLSSKNKDIHGTKKDTKKTLNNIYL